MAIIPYVAETLETLYGHTHLVSWTGLQVGDTGQPLGAPGASDRSVQVSGVFGSDGRTIVEGSNETGAAPNFITLHDPFAQTLIFTGAGMAAISEISGLIRPRITGTDPTTLLTVSLVLRRML